MTWSKETDIAKIPGMEHAIKMAKVQEDKLSMELSVLKAKFDAILSFRMEMETELYRLQKIAGKA